MAGSSGVNGSYELRESLTSYEGDFGPKNVDLRLKNAFYRDISFCKTITSPGPTQEEGPPTREEGRKGGPSP